MLRGATPAWDNVVYYEMEDTRAIRSERWKYVARHPAGPFELYDLQADPQERFNLFGQPGTEAARADAAARLASFFATYVDPRFDRWKGGRNAARLDSP